METPPIDEAGCVKRGPTVERDVGRYRGDSAFSNGRGLMVWCEK